MLNSADMQMHANAHYITLIHANNASCADTQTQHQQEVATETGKRGLLPLH